MHTANYLESSGVIEGGQVGWMGARVGERAGGGGGARGGGRHKKNLFTNHAGTMA